MNNNEAIEFIHSVSNYFCKPGLDRIKGLCEFLGNPQDDLKFIHVAGTNGKGSFCAMLSSILSKTGLKVGRYTSPFILEFNERIAVNNTPISNNDLIRIVEKIKAYCDSLEDKPTEFEIITAIGFYYFKEQHCDVILLECGLGGRFDATNIITSPLLSVITGIDFDHQNFLGDTVEEIAFEKAGIIKKGIPVLWCGDNQKAKAVIESTAKEMAAPFYTVKRKSVIKKTDISGTVFDYDNLEISLPLLGAYQVTNAENVLSAITLLDFNISDNDIKEGIKAVKWPARMEVLSKEPLIIFDGAHNPQGINACVESVKMYFGTKKVNVLSGVMADKDYTFMAGKIAEIALEVYTVTPSNPRALSAEKYATVFKSAGINATAYNDIKSALDHAKSNNEPLVIMGSLYLYGDIFKLI